MRLNPVLVSFFVLSAAIGGCQRPQPAVPEKTEAEQAADTVDDYVSEIRNREKPILSAHRSQLSRLDDVLTLSRNGQEVATFTDSEDRQWEVRSVFQTAIKEKMQTFFMIVPHIYGSDATNETFIFDETGTLVSSVLDDAIVTEGPLIASGSGDTPAGRMTIIDDWSQVPHLIFEFQSPCDPVKWINPTTLAATCHTEYYDGETEAIVTRVSPSEWHLKETVTPDVEKREASAQSRVADAAVAVALKRYDERVHGEPVVDRPPDAETLKVLSEAGYARVTP